MDYIEPVAVNDKVYRSRWEYAVTDVWKSIEAQIESGDERPVTKFVGKAVMGLLFINSRLLKYPEAFYYTKYSRRRGGYVNVRTPSFR